ncbi:leucyl aminopeptidase family protein [Algoriphagus namhaensis]
MTIKPTTQLASDASVRIIPVLKAGLSALSQFTGDKAPSEKIFDAEPDSNYWMEQEGQLIVLLGLGEGKDPKKIQNSFRKLLSKSGKYFDQTAVIYFSEHFTESQILDAVIGFRLGSYHADFYKKEPKSTFENLEVNVYSALASPGDTLEKAEKIASARIESMRLVDLPPSVKTPSYLAQWAEEKGREYGFKTTIIDQKEAEELGLHAFLAVARGSAKAPKFILMEYQGPSERFHLGLVGKGVTFDTGGLNIKTQGMHHMKSDMGGAAAVLGTMQLVTSLQLPIRLTAIVPAVENAVSKEAFLPSEVIQSYSGLSIEVIDTDAEGRLILADGLAYLRKNFDPKYLIDLATLTGSSVGTFGYECGALFSNNDSISENLKAAGERSFEKVWPLPLWESYAKEMDSDIADIKNYHGKPIAGAITAAKFLEAFIDKHPAWAHLDIAGVAFGDSEFSKSKTGTAFGVQLLLNFIENELNHGS